MKLLLISAFLAACMLLSPSCLFSQGQIQGKYALVIGVKDYQYVQPLKNPLNDAMDMSAILKTKGFQVVESYNPKTKRDLKDDILKYFNLINGKSGAAGLIFYSGHSMQVDGVNYFMPTTSNPQIKADVDDQGVRMDYVLSALEQAGNPLNIFIIDACRNNPFLGLTRGSNPGLSQVNTPKGSYLVYATAPGSVASDGEGRNGLFTSKLLKYIDAPSLDIEQVFKFVARDVQKESGGNQVPWINYSYFGDFYFYELMEADQLFAQGNYQEAFKIYRKAADQGDATAQDNLGLMYYNGYGVDKDQQTASSWYHKAAAQGNVVGQNNLGWMYQYGFGVDQNEREAAKWFRKAAEQGDANGQNNLGMLLARGGMGVEQRPEEAKKWYRKAADQGNAAGQNSLGTMYYLEQNYQEAVNWYRMAADQGNAAGESNLGLMYYKGYGVTQNYEEAVKLYRKAADQGDITGQKNLGYMYFEGLGVPQNFAEAMKWYRQAADQGDADSQYNLGNMYEQGKGVGKDIEQAILWYTKAALQGDKASERKLNALKK